MRLTVIVEDREAREGVELHLSIEDEPEGVSGWLTAADALRYVEDVLERLG